MVHVCLCTMVRVAAICVMFVCNCVYGGCVCLHVRMILVILVILVMVLGSVPGSPWIATRCGGLTAPHLSGHAEHLQFGPCLEDYWFQLSFGLVSMNLWLVLDSCQECIKLPFHVINEGHEVTVHYGSVMICVVTGLMCDSVHHCIGV